MPEPAAESARKGGAHRVLWLAVVLAAFLVGGALAIVALRGEAMLLDLASAVWALCF